MCQRVYAFVVENKFFFFSSIGHFVLCISLKSACSECIFFHWIAHQIAKRLGANVLRSAFDMDAIRMYKPIQELV